MSNLEWATISISYLYLCYCDSWCDIKYAIVYNKLSFQFGSVVFYRNHSFLYQCRWWLNSTTLIFIIKLETTLTWEWKPSSIHQRLHIHKVLNLDLIFFSTDGDKRVVVRSCSIPKNDKFDMCTQMKATGSLVTFCETCDSDGCNGASGLASSSLLMALLVALVAYLTKQ